MPWVDDHTVRLPASQTATAQWDSSGLCTWAGVRYSASTTAAAAARAASTSPRVVSAGSWVNSWRASPSSRSTTNGSGSQAGASAASARSAASGVSAATAATAAPA